MTAPQDAPGSDPALWTGCWFALGLIVSAGLSVWLSLDLGNDQYGRLAREIAGTPWLAQTNTKPFEQLLARLIGMLPGDAPALWGILGVVHLAALFALLIRLGGRSSRELPPWALVAAALAAVLNPLVASNFLTLNSVATCALALCGWLIARAEERRILSLAALAVLALSRVDGAVLAGAMALSEIALLPHERRREGIESLVLVAACALVWLVVDRVSNGQWLGVLAATQRYMDATGSAPRGPGAMLWWFVGAWVSNGGKLLTLFALAGVVGLLGRERPSTALRLVAALGAHHGFVLLLGLTGKPFFYRFFVVDFIFIPLLGVFGVWWTGKWVARRRTLPPALRHVAMALVLVAGLLRARDLPALATDAAERKAEAEMAISCMEQSGPPRTGEHWAVPSRLHGLLVWHYRNAPLADLTWDDDYTGALPARILREGQGGAACAGVLSGYAVETRRLPPGDSIR